MKYAMSHTQYPQQPLQTIEEIKTCIAIQNYRAGTYVQVKRADQIHSSGLVSNTLDGTGNKAVGLFLQTDETDVSQVCLKVLRRDHTTGGLFRFELMISHCEAKKI